MSGSVAVAKPSSKQLRVLLSVTLISLAFAFIALTVLNTPSASGSGSQVQNEVVE